MSIRRALGLGTLIAFTIASAACGAQGPRGSWDDDDDDDGSSGNNDDDSSSGVVPVGSGGNGSVNGSGPTSGAGGNGGGTGGSIPSGIPVLGNGQHSVDSVQLATIANSSDGLNEPRDIAFHPTRAGEMWVVNRVDESMTILVGASSGSPSSDTYWDWSSEHFMAQPAALAFSSNGNVATIHETDDYTQGSSTPADFMGPTLWSSNLSIFDAGHEGHLDMLHNSPNGVGIAWESGNAFWVFDGYHSAISRYNFNGDHGPGGSDHSDGEIARYVEGQVKRVPNVSSHMELVGNSLYIADTGNNRVAVLDISSGSSGSQITPNYDYAYQYKVNGASLTTLIDGSTSGISQPSGLAIDGGYLFVSDAASGTIHGFTMGGVRVDWLETGRAGLMGLVFDQAGQLYAADSQGDEVIQISAL